MKLLQESQKTAALTRLVLYLVPLLVLSVVGMIFLVEMLHPGPRVDWTRWVIPGGTAVIMLSLLGLAIQQTLGAFSKHSSHSELIANLAERLHLQYHSSLPVETFQELRRHPAFEHQSPELFLNVMEGSLAGFPILVVDYTPKLLQRDRYETWAVLTDNKSLPNFVLEPRQGAESLLGQRGFSFHSSQASEPGAMDIISRFAENYFLEGDLLDELRLRSLFRLPLLEYLANNPGWKVHSHKGIVVLSRNEPVETAEQRRQMLEDTLAFRVFFGEAKDSKTMRVERLGVAGKQLSWQRIVLSFVGAVIFGTVGGFLLGRCLGAILGLLAGVFSHRTAAWMQPWSIEGGNLGMIIGLPLAIVSFFGWLAARTWLTDLLRWETGLMAGMALEDSQPDDYRSHRSLFAYLTSPRFSPFPPAISRALVIGAFSILSVLSAGVCMFAITLLFMLVIALLQVLHIAPAAWQETAWTVCLFLAAITGMWLPWRILLSRRSNKQAHPAPTSPVTAV